MRWIYLGVIGRREGGWVGEGGGGEEKRWKAVAQDKHPVSVNSNATQHNTTQHNTTQHILKYEILPFFRYIWMILPGGTIVTTSATATLSADESAIAAVTPAALLQSPLTPSSTPLADAVDVDTPSVPIPIPVLS
jgi:hypothetical protein